MRRGFARGPGWNAGIPKLGDAPRDGNIQTLRGPKGLSDGTTKTKVALRRFFQVAGHLVAAALVLTTSGCATLLGKQSALQQGPGTDFVATEIELYVQSQDRVRSALASMASSPAMADSTRPGVSAVPVSDWDGLIDAGMNYADSRCRAYLSALYMLDRNRKTTVAQIGLAGTAAAGLMAAAQSAAKEVAIVAILFGLSASTVDNLAGNVLYELPPSTVESMVLDQQLVFRRALQRGYVNWPSSLGVIQSYALICVPSHIESEINIAVKQSRAAASNGDPSTGQPPAVSNAIAVSSGDFPSGGRDAIGQLLLNFVLPQGTEDPVRRNQLQQYLKQHEGNISVGALISVGANAAARVRAARAMQLIP